MKLLLTALIVPLILCFAFDSSASLFSDIKEHKYEHAILYIENEGIVEGYSDGSYKPDSSINRAELLRIVIDTNNIDVSDDLKNCFSDVKDEWFAKYVCKAKEIGIIEGYPDGTFFPARNVIFVEALKIIELAYGAELGESSPWYKSYVDEASAKNMIPNDIYSFGHAITRGQMADIMTRYLTDEEGIQEEYIMENFGDEQELVTYEDIEFAPVPEEEPSPVVEQPIAEEPIAEEPIAEAVTVAEEESGLTAYAEGNPDANILIAGTSENLVSKYRFHATGEDFLIKKLTIVNDVEPHILGDNISITPAVAIVTIKYPDINGVLQSASSALAGGTAKFAGLGFYAPAHEDVYLEVYADVNTMAAIGEPLSGRTIRLGLQNYDNNISTFEAIGQSYGTNLNFTGTPTASIIMNRDIVGKFVVRKSLPTFTAVNTSSSISDGEKTLMSFSITADTAGAVSFGRLVFDVFRFDAANADLNLSNFKFYRGSTLVTDVNIYKNWQNNIIDLAVTSLDPGNIEDKAIVSFNQEETIVAGASQTYSLKATVIASSPDDTISARINARDEFYPTENILSTSVCGGAADNVICSTGNGNTGRIYDDAHNEALFRGSLGNEFTWNFGDGINIIWSDRSADNHLYPTVDTAGTVTSGSGSYDWTNGHLLDIDDLSSHTLGVVLNCVQSDWSCTEWNTSSCPSGQKWRQCTLINLNCLDPYAVQPANTGSC